MTPNTLRELRRAQIIAAARSIVAQRGLQSLTIGALEGELTFSRGVITYHFRNKDEIVRTVLESAIEEIDKATTETILDSLTPAMKIAAVIRANVRGFVDRAEAGRILLSFWGRIHTDPEIGKLNADLYARYRHGVKKLLLSGIDKGVFVEIDTDAMANLIVGIVIGIATQAYFDPDAINVDAAIHIAEQTLNAKLQSQPG